MRAGLTAALLALTACGRVGFGDRAGTGTDAGVDATAGGDGNATSFAFRDLCGFARYTVIQDNIAVDDAVGATMLSALTTTCGSGPAVRTVSQDDPGILDPGTGRPLLAADDLAVIGGGDGPQRAIAYLLASDTLVTWTATLPLTFTLRATGRTIVSDTANNSHDYPLIMLVIEPIGGAHVLSVSGFTGRGTTAGGYWFANTIAPALADNPDAWTIVAWDNADPDPEPTAGDTWAVVESGRY